MTEATTPSDAEVRFKIAERMIGVGIVGIVVLSVVAIYFADSIARPEMARLVFASILPLLGTWVGTVLAFYFAKDNFQAASDATRETLKQANVLRDDSRVSDLMTPLGKINPIRTVADMAAADGLKLSALNAAMQATNNQRVPVITEKSGIGLLVVHQPDINDYAQRIPVEAANLADDATVEKLRQIPELKLAVETWEALPETATVAEARRKFQESLGCKDIFVTSDGTRSGKVVGWVTNSDLARTV